MAFQHNKKRPLYKSFGENHPSGSKRMRRQLGEDDVYISEYANKDIKGFSGILKQRYADFQVNEIDLDGKVLKLSNFDAPTYPSETEIPDIDAEKIKELLSAEDIARINALTERKDNVKESIEIEVTNFDKEQRTYLHKYVQLASKNVLNSNTVDRDGKKFIEVNNKKKGRQDMRRSNSKRIKFLHFTLMKTNTDTSEMLFLLGKQLSRKVNKFTIAGTKDKRAVTTQRVSGKYVNYADIRHLDLHRVKLGNFEYKDHPIQLGDLKGNFFRIVIRAVTATDEHINQTMEAFKENGFINYFGLQRFGNNPEAATHDVGRLLIQNDWRGAVQLILKPGAIVNPNTAPKIQKVEYLKHRYFETRSAQLTLRGMDDPAFLRSSIEARILHGLATNGENAFLNGLENISRNTATLYLHAYQSYVWNRIVTARLRKFGLAVQAGDLVLVEDTTPATKPADREIKQEKPDDDYEEEDDEQEEITYDVPSSRANIHVVTDADLEAGTYSICDVVYPCPGFDVKLPENEIGTWYYEYLKEDRLDLDSFKNSVKLFSLSGTYRRMVLKAADFAWSILRYDLPDDDIQLSDACVLAGKTLKTFTTLSLKAVRIEMTLPPSVYATMALREVLKVSTPVVAERAIPIPVVKTEEGSYIDY